MMFLSQLLAAFCLVFPVLSLFYLNSEAGHIWSQIWAQKQSDLK